ncbi:MAG: Sjogren's syndrome/scleroderma autoantigen 1 family protein [Promethearchaeota archaeon]
MADLLRSGNTMLNIACPVCNNPLFRNKDNNTFCPTCNRNVLFINKNSFQDEAIKKTEVNYSEQENKHHNRQIKLLYSLQETLLEKIEIITKKLKNETQLQLIKTYTKILLNCLEILNKISFQKNY